MSDQPHTERWSAALADRYERLENAGVLLGVLEAVDVFPGLAEILPSGPVPRWISLITQLRARPLLIAQDEQLLAEFEGVLALQRKRPGGRSLSIVTKRVPGPAEKDAWRDRANLTWVIFGDIARSPKTGKPALRSFGLAPLPGAATGLSEQARSFHGVTQDVLRAVPTSELVDMVIRQLIEQKQWVTTLETRPGHLWERPSDSQREALARIASIGLPPKRGRPVDLAHYQRIARRIVELEQGGRVRGLARVIAEEEKVSEVSAYRWIQKVRKLTKAGLLPPPTASTQTGEDT